MITPGGRVGDSSSLASKPGGKRRLDDYVRAVAHALMRKHGWDKGHAIAVAKNSLKRWAAGGGKVRPQVRAGATAHLATQKAIDHSLAVPAGASSQDGPRATLPGMTASVSTRKTRKLPPKMRLRAELKRRQKLNKSRTANLAVRGDELTFDLVGPKGYVHGWRYVGGPGLPAHKAARGNPFAGGKSRKGVVRDPSLARSKSAPRRSAPLVGDTDKVRGEAEARRYERDHSIKASDLPDSVKWGLGTYRKGKDGNYHPYTASGRKMTGSLDSPKSPEQLAKTMNEYNREDVRQHHIKRDKHGARMSSGAPQVMGPDGEKRALPSAGRSRRTDVEGHGSRDRSPTEAKVEGVKAEVKRRLYAPKTGEAPFRTFVSQDGYYKVLDAKGHEVGSHKMKSHASRSANAGNAGNADSGQSAVVESARREADQAAGGKFKGTITSLGTARSAAGSTPGNPDRARAAVSPGTGDKDERRAAQVSTSTLEDVANDPEGYSPGYVHAAKMELAKRRLADRSAAGSTPGNPVPAPGSPTDGPRRTVRVNDAAHAATESRAEQKGLGAMSDDQLRTLAGKPGPFQGSAKAELDTRRIRAEAARRGKA